MNAPKNNPVQASAAQQANRMRRVQRVHFVGIGGAGMSGIAELMANLGYTVSGSDLHDGSVVRRLREQNIEVMVGHAAANVEGVDVVVTSTAVAGDNPEVQYAKANLIPVVPRAEMLAELMRFRYGIAVAGTHGKTTTTSLIASVLEEAGLDPTFIIGGRLNSAGANAGLGSSPYLVAEADESDASFLYLQPTIAIVTNIDADHMETYEGDFDKLRGTFVKFLHHLPFYGLAIVCIDDPVVAGLLPEIGRPVRTYGFSEEADLRITQLKQEGTVTRFTTVERTENGNLEYDITLNMPGRHNVLNAMAAVAVARELDVPPAAITAGLSGFAGVGRRYSLLGQLSLPAGGSVELVDDYAHHPRELSATFAATKAAWPERRIVAVFQPHRYSRTRDLFDEFCDVLGAPDLLLITEVYAAGEQPVVGADGRALCKGLRSRGRADPVFLPDLAQLNEVLNTQLQDGDVLLLLGAGSIGRAAKTLAAEGLAND